MIQREPGEPFTPNHTHKCDCANCHNMALERIKSLTEELAVIKSSWNQAINEYKVLEKENASLRESEKKLSDAYLRIREKLKAWDTPYAPTPEQVYELTEKKLDALHLTAEEMKEALELLYAGIKKETRFAFVEELLDKTSPYLSKKIEAVENAVVALRHIANDKLTYSRAEELAREALTLLNEAGW